MRTRFDFINHFSASRLVLVLVFVVAMSAFADVYTWTGGGNDGGLWTTPQNWGRTSDYPNASTAEVQFNGGCPGSLTAVSKLVVGMTPQQALDWVEENMIPYYPLGVYKDKTSEEGEK